MDIRQLLEEWGCSDSDYPQPSDLLQWCRDLLQVLEDIELPLTPHDLPHVARWDAVVADREDMGGQQALIDMLRELGRAPGSPPYIGQLIGRIHLEITAARRSTANPHLPSKPSLVLTAYDLQMLAEAIRRRLVTELREALDTYDADAAEPGSKRVVAARSGDLSRYLPG